MKLVAISVRSLSGDAVVVTPGASLTGGVPEAPVDGGYYARRDAAWVPLGDAGGVPGPDGASAYEVAVAAGFVGDATAWLASLRGAAGADGADGVDGVDGDAGAPGASAYEVAVSAGFVGDATAWLASLQGADGADGADGVDGDVGAPGASAYEVAVAAGFVGDATAWLASLQGADGADGADGAAGSDAVWTEITQAAFDALDPPDPDTLYVVIG